MSNLPTLILMVTICAASCLAQTNMSPIQATQWGQSVKRIQLTTSVTNNILPLGSSINISMQIKNLSKNLVGVPQRLINNVAMPMIVPMCIVQLTNGGGKGYTLTPDSLEFAVPPPSGVYSGTTNAWKIPLDVKGDIERGNYMLKITQRVYFMDGESHDGFQLVSNLIKVQVK